MYICIYIYMYIYVCREHDAEQKCGDNINTFILAVIKFALPQCTYGTAMKETEVATPDSQHATNRLLFLLSLAMCQYALEARLCNVNLITARMTSSQFLASSAYDTCKTQEEQ